MPTKERINKVEKVLGFRQPDLRIVLEEVTNTHNASAVVRTCDAAGILNVDIIYSDPADFPVNEAISTRADKWLNLNHYHSTTACFKKLKKQGFKIAATHLGSDSVPYTSLDYTQPIAVVFGNESDGISEKARKLADCSIKIPMFGMSQSLNISVSAGIILYEAIKQRLENGYFKESRLSPQEFEQLRNKWLKIE